MTLKSTLFNYYKMPLVFVVLSVLFYSSFAYDLVRTDITKLLLLYSALFIFSFQLIKYSGFNFRILVIVSILFRLVFLVSTPNLSQDFYRFIWDGRMLFEGLNPYLYTPDSFIIKGSFPIEQALELYNGMGPLSSSHYTNYPPLNQLCFFLASLFGSKSIFVSVIVLRVIIISADIGILYFGKKLLERLKLPSSRIWWYILNPFIIIELTGNIHFEGVMLFFVIWSLYLLQLGKWKKSALVFAFSISVKLIPLMFLPLFIRWFIRKKIKPSDQPTLGFRKLILFYFIIGLVVTGLFLPFFSTAFISNYSQTVALWFSDFEFNASVYYVFREIGYALSGFNQIALIGQILPVITLVLILGISFIRSNNDITQLATSMVLSLAIYLFLSTTVHPWYIATLVVLCVFTNYRFPLYWSLVISLSYLAYANSELKENLWIISLEYVFVFLAFFWEVFAKKRLPLFKQSF